MTERIPLLAISLFLIILSGLVHGRWTNRWGQTPEIRTAVERFDRIPLTVGEWTGEADRLSRKEMKQADVDGAAIRRYRNRSTGSEVAILIVCGRPGPIYVHTPEICYGEAGYERELAPIRLSLKSEEAPEPAIFQLERYRGRSTKSSGPLSVLWSFRVGRSWCMPDRPRAEFAARSLLYKMYVVYRSPLTGLPPDDGPQVEFVRRQLLPELDRVLFTPAG